MTTPNFEEMNKSELRAYLKRHPNDTQAFNALIDKDENEQNRVFYLPEEGGDELAQAIQAKKLTRDDAA